MQEPRTTVVYKGVVYPFYKTNRGQFDFYNAGFTTEQTLSGHAGALLALVYYNLKDCAKRACLPFSDSFEQFIDDSDPDITDVFMRLNEVRKMLMEKEGTAEPVK